MGTVAGFFSAGAIGLFTIGAAAVNEILAQEKARRAARIQYLLDSMLNDAQQADAIIEQQRQNELLKLYALCGADALAVGGVAWWLDAFGLNLFSQPILNLPYMNRCKALLGIGQVGLYEDEPLLGTGSGSITTATTEKRSFRDALSAGSGWPKRC